jgi:hypothetical protein
LVPSRPLAADQFDPSDYFAKREGRGRGWAVGVSPSLGYNQLIKGYKGYSNLGSAGIDLWVRPVRPRVEAPSFRYNFLFRLSAEYLPMKVPDGNYGLQEDMFDATASVLYRLRSFAGPEADHWIPFTGLGGGVYSDWTRLDTPASGKISGMHHYSGAVFSLGAFSPRWRNIFQFVPEVRFHMLRIPDSKWSMNLVYQAGLYYEFGRRDDE